MRLISGEHRKKGRPKKVRIEGIRRSTSDRGINDENVTTDNNGGWASDNVVGCFDPELMIIIIAKIV